MTPEHVTGIAGIVEAMEMLESTTFISFAGNNLLHLRTAYPTAKAQFLSGSADESVAQWILDNGFDADIYYKSLTKEFIDLMHAHGRVVNAWTVDTLDAAESLRDMGIDMITSNILE